MAQQRRGLGTTSDMVRSMLVLAIPVLLIAGWVALSRDEQDPVREVDYAAELTSARASAPFALLAPEELGAEWRATSARYEPDEELATWHLGYVSPDDDYVGLEQSNDRRTDVLDSVLDSPQAQGEETIAGSTWERLVETGQEDNDRALVRTQDDVTTVVVGSASWDELATFAAALR